MVMVCQDILLARGRASSKNKAQRVREAEVEVKVERRPSAKDCNRTGPSHAADLRARRCGGGV